MSHPLGMLVPRAVLKFATAATPVSGAPHLEPSLTGSTQPSGSRDFQWVLIPGQPPASHRGVLC